jgi:CHAT domain
MGLWTSKVQGQMTKDVLTITVILLFIFLAFVVEVESESNAALMIAFHKNLQTHVSKSEALRAAELQVMKTEKFNHPFYWAAFVMIGDST